jgi:hypothetical protein
MAKNPKQQAAIAMAMKAAGKKPKMEKGGATGGTALKNALIKAGYKKGGSVKKK